MNERRGQSFIWIIIGLMVLVGVGAIAFLGGSLFSGFSSTGEQAAPTNTPLPPPIVTIQGIKQQAKLVTVEQRSIAEIYHENIPDSIIDEFFGTKERLLMLVYGDVKAGFDLEKLEEGDLWAEGKRVRLILPAPEIISSSVDFDKTHIVFYESNILFDENDPNLQGAALSQAKQSLEKAALEAQILNQANQFGKVYFEKFLYSLGFSDVEVVIDAQIFEE